MGVRRSFVRAILPALVVLLLASSVFAAASHQILHGTVTRAIDGDTIEVYIGNTLEKVRYIGINTPEIHHPTRGQEPYGEAAKEANRQLVEGKAVSLVLDLQQRDRYGRLLAYVYVGDLFVNAELVGRGFAQVATFPPNVRYRKEFIVLQRQARDARRGLWGDEEALKYYQPGQSGVVGAQRIKTYFHPDDYGWQHHGSVVYFDSESDAQKAGYQPSFNYALHREREWRALYGEAYGSGDSVSSAGGASSLGVLSGTSSSRYGTTSGSGRSPGTDVSVRGHMRGGMYVAPYTRGAPGSGSGRK